MYNIVILQVGELGPGLLVDYIILTNFKKF